jgi:hypothetical protein
MRLQGLTLLLVFFRYISSTLFFSFTPFKYIYHSFNLWHLLCLNWKTCVKHCSQAERDQVFEELRPHFLNLAYSAYAVHLVKKMLDNGNGLLEICARVYMISCVFVLSVSHFILIGYHPFSASKKQLAGFISTLRGHVAPLLRHMVGSVGM